MTVFAKVQTGSVLQTQVRGEPDLLGRLVKLTEETGELAQAVLGATGHPNRSKSAPITMDEVREEAVDVSICAMDIFIAAGGSFEDFEDLLVKKVAKWRAKFEGLRSQNTFE